MRRLGFPAEARQRLASQQGGLRIGCSKDLTTPLVPLPPQGVTVSKEVSRAAVLLSFTLDCALEAVKLDRLKALEYSKRSSIGGSSMRPGFRFPATQGDSLEDQIRKYFIKRDPIHPNSAAMEYATKQVSALYEVGRFGRLEPIDLDVAAAQKFPRGTGLGYPVITSDPKYLFEVYKISEEIHNSGYDLSWVAELPALLGVRGQPRGPESVVGTPYAKTRVIYAMPRAVMNAEKRIQFPLQGFLKKREEFCAWVGRDAVAKSITRLFARKSRKQVLSVDFKSFDVSVPEIVTNEIFNIIEGWMTKESGPLVRFCKEAFQRTGILCPDLYLPGSARSGGVPSGSVMTNLIDSLANLWVMHYAAARNTSSLLYSIVQGDDGVYTFQGNVQMSEVAEAVSELGMKLSPEKSMMCEDAVHFLQDLHCVQHVVGGINVGMRPLTHILNSAMSMERNDGKSWDRECDTVRWLQQFGEGLHHPHFALACDWLVKHDWLCEGLLLRLRNDNAGRLREILSCVNRKDSNSFWGLTESSFLTSPVVKYLRERPKSSE